MTIELRDVRKSYRRADGTVAAVLNVPSLSVKDAEAVCVVGGSGTGKTTLLNVIAGIITPDSGSVTINGTDVTRLSEAARDRHRARHIGYVFQTFNLLQGFSAVENILLPMSFAGMGRTEARNRAHILLDRVGLAGKGRQRPSGLSVGEQQRVALARAVACRPSVILADEPTANLDPANATVAMALLREVAAEVSAMLIVVTHDQRLKGEFARVETLAVPS